MLTISFRKRAKREVMLAGDPVKEGNIVALSEAVRTFSQCAFNLQNERLGHVHQFCDLMNGMGRVEQ